MGWRLAGSLVQLRKEFDQHAPKRSKKSDGTLGDPAHKARASRHNPNNSGVVCALDITDDPQGGCPVHLIARRLVEDAKAGKTNPCFEYVISNRKVARRSRGWNWDDYTGANAHTQHAHFAVGRGPDSEPTQPYDDETPWGVADVPDEEDDLPYSRDDLKAIVREVLAERPETQHAGILYGTGKVPNAFLVEPDGWLVQRITTSDGSETRVPLQQDCVPNSPVAVLHGAFGVPDRVDVYASLATAPNAVCHAWFNPKFPGPHARGWNVELDN